jgi:hypothetical protein
MYRSYLRRCHGKTDGKEKSEGEGKNKDCGKRGDL